MIYRLIIALFIASLPQLTLAWSDSPNLSNSNTNTFEDYILQIQRNCSSLNCAELGIELQKISYSEMSKQSESTAQKLQAIANSLANEIWPDTILEGPYEVAEKIKIDEIGLVLNSSGNIGFRITYSDNAWDTDTCTDAELNSSNLSSCESGRIVESAFVSLDFKEYFRDDNAYAEFISDSNQ